MSNNIVNEKARTLELLGKMDSALRANDYEVSYAIFQLLGRHMGKLMAATSVVEK